MKRLLAEGGPRTVALSALSEPPTFANVAEGPDGRPGWRTTRGVRLAASPDWPGPEWPRGRRDGRGGKEQSQLLSSDSDDSSSLDARCGQQRRGDLRERIRELCDGNAWQATVMCAIVLNTVSMAIECDTYKWPGWRPINHGFLSFFVFELTVRLFAFGAEFFTNPEERRGNLFDFCLVLMGVGDQWIRPLLMPHNKNKANKALAVLRQFRILRVFRSVRLIRQVPELHRLVVGFVDALQAAGWLLTLFMAVIFFVGLVLTLFVGHNYALWKDPEKQDEIQEYFGTLSATMFTMFRYVTLDDWSFITSIVMEQFPVMSIAFCTYQFVMAFTMISLLTGVIAENYHESGRKKDMEDSVADFNQFLKTLEPFFRESKASALYPEKASRSPLLDIKADVTDVRQASTALARDSSQGEFRLQVLSLEGFLVEDEDQKYGEDHLPRRVKISGPHGIDEYKLIDALIPCSSDDEYSEIILKESLDQDWPKKTRVEAVHPLISAVIGRAPGSTDSDAVGFLQSFDNDGDNVLSFKDEFSRGMQLFVHGDRKPKKMDLQVIHTEVRRIGDLLGCPVASNPANPAGCPVKQSVRPLKADPRYEAWKRKEAQLDRRLRKIEDLLATLIRATASGVAAPGPSPPLFAGR